MNKNLLEKVKRAAERDKVKRRDPRFLRAMAFLTRKGILRANRDYQQWYFGKLHLKDALWAGKNLEPRILEVLPAIAVRLPKEVVYTDAPPAFLKAIEALKSNQLEGPDFLGVPFEKYKTWLNLKLADGRTKPVNQHKIMRSFRLSPDAIRKIEEKMKELNLSGAEVIESLLN
ncbi:MAG: hypothetical protein KDD25_01225 [Bdellovibrionales bacterium]|nr:hypothetical protein [Bdellovibrionales bacterium]